MATGPPRAGHFNSQIIRFQFEIDVFSLPFLYQDAVEALRVANGPFGAKLVPKVNATFDCEVIGFTTDGVTEFYSRTRRSRGPRTW